MITIPQRHRRMDGRTMIALAIPRSARFRAVKKIKRYLSGDTTVEDLGDISRSLYCFTSNFS